MNGMELCKAFFEECGRPVLEKQFPDLMPYLAAGLTGSGSECLGYDDEISRDHDFEPGFCLFLPGEDVVDRRSAFLLERAYAKLPRVFMGIPRLSVSPAGGARHGVFRTSEFFMEKTGTSDGKPDLYQWLTLPEQSLLEAVNGAVFLDHYGEVSAIRENLAYFPEDIRLKRLAGHLLLMAQAGQYNYMRCLTHGEPAAAQLAIGEFVRSTISVIFLLNRRYQPYYKWAFRALKDLPKLSGMAEDLGFLLENGNAQDLVEKKSSIIEKAASSISLELEAQSLVPGGTTDLERQSYAVESQIGDPRVRSLHILAGV